MTQVSRKGFVDKNGQKVVIVPNIPGATEGNIASFDAEGNLQDSGKKASDFAPATHEHSQYLTQHQDISGKADKVANTTENNFAALDANGNLKDSGKKASDFLTSQDISGKADKVANASAGHLASLDANGNPQDSGYAISAGSGVYSGNRDLVTGGQVCEFAELPVVQLVYTVSGTASSNPLPSRVTDFDGIVEKINRYGGSGNFLVVVDLSKEENGSTTTVGQSLALLRYIVRGTQMDLEFRYGHSVINKMVCTVSGDPNAGTLVVSQVTGSQITRNELDNYFESVLGS